MVAKKRRTTTGRKKGSKTAQAKPTAAETKKPARGGRGKKAVEEALAEQPEVVDQKIDTTQAEIESNGQVEIEDRTDPGTNSDGSEPTMTAGQDTSAGCCSNTSSFSQMSPSGEGSNGTAPVPGTCIDPDARKKQLKKFQVMEKRKKIANLYSQGKAQWAIAKQLGVSIATVGHHLKKIRELWKASAVIDYDERKAQELAKIDHLEEIAWEAWDKSCLDFRITTRKTEFAKPPKEPEPKKRNKYDSSFTHAKLIPIRSSIVEVTEGRTGDPRFLDRIAWCIETRMKLFGLLDQSPHNVNQFTVHWDSLFTRPTVMDPIESRIKAVETLGNLQSGATPSLPARTAEEEAHHEGVVAEQEQKVAETEADVRESLK